MTDLSLTSKVSDCYTTSPMGKVFTLDKTSLDKFLASIEKRAFLIARQSVGNTEDALDLVQDAMFQLVKRYSDKDPDEWPPLFYRILKNRIIDFHRRNAVQNRFRVMFDWLRPKSNDTDNQIDPYEYVSGRDSDTPVAEIESEQRVKRLQVIVNELPPRQRQAFQFRCWEGLSTIDTAKTMGCSEGSVKTHYFRALKTIRSQLEGF
jgi:RNA polymerase sigma-70 factor (ECF subfamily)